MSPVSAAQRVRAVLRGEMPDRVPCIPLVYYFAATSAGVPQIEFIRSMRAYRRAMDRCFDEVGPWDAMYPLPVTMDAPEYHIVWGAGVGMKPTDPHELRSDAGEDTQLFQFVESGELMRGDDYGTIGAFPLPGTMLPYLKFLELMVARSSGRSPGLGMWARHLLPQIARFGGNWLSEVARWAWRRVPMFVGFTLEAPFDTFSMARGVEEFAVDLYRRGDQLRDAVMRLSRSYAEVARYCCRATGTKNFLLLVHRSSNDFISPDHYRRFSHPSIKLIAETLARDGIITGLHADGDWTLNFDSMLDLPRDTYIQLDGFSDIRQARRTFGDRFTLMGDVPPQLLAFGTPAEVDRYCRDLIADVGQNGRFILSSGCEVPPNAKPDNVRAMIAAAKRYGRYR